MPSRWQIHLDGPPRPAISPESVHAVVSRWLDDDHKAVVKPYAVSPPRCDATADTRTVLEVRLVDDALASRALSVQAMREVWVCDLDGRSEVLKLRDTVVSGFVGRIRYACEGTPTEAADVDALFGFARYAGIGSHTTFGLGTVDVQRHQGTSLTPFTAAAAARPARSKRQHQYRGRERTSE